MRLPHSIQKVIDGFEQLPGIGPKSAQKLAYYMLRVPQEKLDNFGEAIANIKKQTKWCKYCFNISESEVCHICNDETRDHHKICVVGHPLDIFAIEKSGAFKGVYHVLHGLISPLDNIGPEQLHLHDLLPRLSNGYTVEEVIVATNPTMEGEATALYIKQLIEQKYPSIKVSRLGHGLPIGADLEYADEVTLLKSFEGRTSL